MCEVQASKRDESLTERTPLACMRGVKASRSTRQYSSLFGQQSLIVTSFIFDVVFLLSTTNRHSVILLDAYTAVTLSIIVPMPSRNRNSPRLYDRNHLLQNNESLVFTVCKTQQ